MSPEAVDKMLARYMAHKARCEFLESYIAELREILRSARATMRADAANGVQVISGMPHGSGTSDPTGRYGLLFAEGWMPEDMKEVEAEIQARERELRLKMVTVTLTQKILSVLTDKESMLVEGKDLQGLSWRELGEKYRAAWGVEVSRDTLRRMYRDAKQKMYEVAK